jgi:hypothetical protein
MSLIGILEDLNLGDILQIVSLSQKSGVLVLRTDKGEGRVLFRGGMVCGATLKNGPQDLRGVLVTGGLVSDADFDEAERTASAEGVDLDAVLVRAGGLTREGIESLCRKSIEAAVVEMFGWSVGDFSFDVRELSEVGDPPVMLATGINAQYLAMEAARREDERSRNPEPQGGSEDGLAPDESDSSTAGRVADSSAATVESADPVAAPEETDATSAVVESVALAAAGRAQDEVIEEPEASRAERGDDDSHESESTRVASASAESPPSEPVAQDTNAEAGILAPAAIVIDVELPALEWIKQTLSPDFTKVHIFQRQDLGLSRIRQYLAHAQTPCVLVSPRIGGDALSGIRDSSDFVRRLKQQAPHMLVLWLDEDGADPAQRSGADGAVVRPACHQLRNNQSEDRVEGLRESLRSDLREKFGRAPLPQELAENPQASAT